MGTMAKPNLFVMSHDPGDDEGRQTFERVRDCLCDEFEVTLLDVDPAAYGSSGGTEEAQRIPLKCVAVDSGKTEEIRDRIKEALWPAGRSEQSPMRVRDILTAGEDREVRPCRLSDYGAFVPHRTKKHKELRTHSFRHKQMYRYRLAVTKAERLPESLRAYLELVFTDCPNHLFRGSRFRVSHIGYENRISVELAHEQHHPLTKLTRDSESYQEYRSRHENVQKFLLENDPCTVASEIPVWIEPRDLADYADALGRERPLTGHIDLLRHEEDGKIGVWDYKPGAPWRSARTQVFFYAFILAVRTGIKLGDFVCGYFDENDLFRFDPTEIQAFGAYWSRGESSGPSEMRTTPQPADLG